MDNEYIKKLLEHFEDIMKETKVKNNDQYEMLKDTFLDSINKIQKGYNIKNSW